MEIEEKLFIDKFQPIYFKDFEIDDKIIKIDGEENYQIYNKLGFISFL